MKPETLSERVVLVISGPSGAGKTSLVNKVGEMLEDSVTLFYDYYDPVGEYHPDQSQWIKEGCDPNTWVKIPKLVEDLITLRAGHPIIRPEGDHFPANVPRKKEIQSAQYIVLEEPWGRDRQEICPHINLVFHIDVPLDISLCRRMIRDADYQHPLDRAKEYLNESLHDFYKRQQLVGENADLVLNGLKPIETIAREIIAYVNQAAED